MSDRNQVSIGVEISKDISDELSGATGSMISLTGDIIDIDTGGTLGGKVLGKVGGPAVDAFIRSLDAEGFTLQDGVAVGSGILSGMGTGAALGADAEKTNKAPQS